MDELEELMTLPPVRDAAPEKPTWRKYQMSVTTDTFLKLEYQAARRGMTSYKLAASIITMFVNGKLVVKKDDAAKEDNQNQGKENE